MLEQQWSMVTSSSPDEGTAAVSSFDRWACRCGKGPECGSSLPPISSCVCRTALPRSLGFGLLALVYLTRIAPAVAARNLVYGH